MSSPSALRNRFKSFTAMGILLSVFSLAVCQSAVIVTTTTVGTDFRYEYQLDNTAGGFEIYSWSLEFDVAPGDLDWDRRDLAAGGDVTVPTGAATAEDDWISGEGIPLVRLSSQDFISVDPGGGGDVSIGESLVGFAFTSSLPPGPITYFEYGGGGEVASGITMGPMPIPEPQVGLLLLLSVFVSLRRHRLAS